ncbi:MAG: molybdenum cofactor guanylyltransferase MobA, partial [Gammaproteobacteria bacterium]
GEDKGLVEFLGKPLIEHILAAVAPQVDQILINANRNQQRYQSYGYPVLTDELADYQGPLAGFLTGLRHCQTRDLVTLPCDGPFVAPDLVERLLNARLNEDAELAVAHDGERLQPVYALLNTELTASLNGFLDRGDRKIDLWYAEHRMAKADFSDTTDTFANINRPDDRERLAGLAAAHDLEQAQ